MTKRQALSERLHGARFKPVVGSSERRRQRPEKLESNEKIMSQRHGASDKCDESDDDTRVRGVVMRKSEAHAALAREAASLP